MYRMSVENCKYKNDNFSPLVLTNFRMFGSFRQGKIREYKMDHENALKTLYVTTVFLPFAHLPKNRMPLA